MSRRPIGPDLVHDAEDPRESYLIGGECPVCGLVLFPRLWICPRCLDRNDPPVQIRLSGDAVIDRFCVSQRGPRRFSPPYVQSYVRLAEGPLIFTQIRGVTEADPPLRRGEPVRMGVEVAYTDDDGTDVIGWAAHRP